MKHEMRRWDRDREWLARRFCAGWVCLLTAAMMLTVGWIWMGAAVVVVAAGLLWSAR